LGWELTKQTKTANTHIQLAENLEITTRKRRRSGRNGEKAFAVLLTESSDIIQEAGQFIHVCDKKL
jgi:ATP-dependent DNA helicase RecQ